MDGSAKVAVDWGGTLSDRGISQRGKLAVCISEADILTGSLEHPTDMPLVIDLDGTLSVVDNLVEALTTLFLKRPAAIPGMLAALLKGRHVLKDYLARLGCYQPEHIPLREDLVRFLVEQHEAGREIHLVTASPQSVADSIASRVRIFTSAVGSTRTNNLKGRAKLSRLKELFPDGFVYAGNDRSDLAVWKESEGVIVAGSQAGVVRAAGQIGVPVEAYFPDQKTGLRVWAKAIRMHQWAKNALMFVPLILSHQYGDPVAFVTITLGFICMGLVASATYILNDLSDLSADRRHHSKRHRPIASGLVSAQRAIVVGLALGLIGLTGAFALNLWFAMQVLAYVALTLAYSLRLKAVAMLDVFALGMLFTLRILMGATILGIVMSPWLLVFSMFFFFSLSTAKRHVEIVRAVQRGETGRINGRGYQVEDAPLTLALGIASSLAATTLMFLYVVNDAYPHEHYKNPEWLLGIAFLVFLWTGRVWMKSHRGRLDDDPVVFALKDPTSWTIGGAILVTFTSAIV